MTGIKKLVKVNDLNLSGKFLVYPKWVKYVTFGCKIITFELFSKFIQ